MNHMRLRGGHSLESRYPVDVARSAWDNARVGRSDGTGYPEQNDRLESFDLSGRSF